MRFLPFLFLEANVRKRLKGMDGHRIREICVMSFADPRTVQRFLRGQTVRPSSRRRIEAALDRLRLADVKIASPKVRHA